MSNRKSSHTRQSPTHLRTRSLVASRTIDHSKIVPRSRRLTLSELIIKPRIRSGHRRSLKMNIHVDFLCESSRLRMGCGINMWRTSIRLELAALQVIHRLRCKRPPAINPRLHCFDVLNKPTSYSKRQFIHKLYGTGVLLLRISDRDSRLCYSDLRQRATRRYRPLRAASGDELLGTGR